MALFHPTLTSEKWQAMPRHQQILNIAAELNRARRALERKETQYLMPSLDRVFELLDLTIEQSAITRGMRRELLRLREMLGEWYVGTEESPDKLRQAMRIFIQLNPTSSQITV